MKFGRNLSRNQVPEWASQYIKYKALKKLIKAAAEDARSGGGVDTAEFFYSLDRNLEDVDGFYNKKYADAARRLKLLHDRFGRYQSDPPIGMCKEDVEDLMGALLELRGQLKHLQWYGEVNRRGFVKITKKLDKRAGQTATQRRYLETKVDPKPFANNVELLQTKATVNEWISKLSDVKIQDDASSTHSSHSAHLVSNSVLSSLPNGLLDSADLAVRHDNVLRLREVLSEAKVQTLKEANEDLHTALCLSLLQRAITNRALGCIDETLSHAASLEESDDINSRNCLHRLIIGAGRTVPSSDEESGSALVPTTLYDRSNYIKPAAAPMLIPRTGSKQEAETDLEKERESQTDTLLTRLLEKMQPHQRTAIRARDIYGRVPLHYAAQYGFMSVCQTLVNYMHKWGKFKNADGIDAPFWPDTDGYAPLHLSVIGGHPLTTKTLLNADELEVSTRKAALRKSTVRSGEVLALAVKSNFVVIVRLVVEAGFDVNHQDDQGETALHVAARGGHTACARILVDAKANLELGENSFGWTPLHVAAVDGQFEIVQLLIEAGSDLEKLDTSGWTAKEHASLRGHLDVANALATLTRPKVSCDIEASLFGNVADTNRSTLDRKSASNTTANGNGSVKKPEPVKSFGHRYLTTDSMILVSLGSMDGRKALEAVNLDRIALTDAHSTQLDTALSVVVSAQGATGEPSIIDLPVEETISTEPVVFHASDPASVKVIFDIVPTYAGSSSQVVGRGVALLSTIKPTVGSKRINLQGDLSVPIMASDTMNIIGTVNFSFLVITPFSHPNMGIAGDRTYWKKMTSTMLIGHRGLGKNVAGRGSLQLGENTIQSFIAAANLGASYVEFDVQLTKDLVPVIYHDFLVSETGIDAPVHTLTLDQFLSLNEGRTSRGSRAPSPSSGARDITFEGSNGGMPESRRHRSLSLTGAGREDDLSSMSDRMRNTRDFKAKGFKANTRGNFIQGAFTTLEEMFRKLPETTGFNIEMKYPMLFESEEQEMDTYAVELNSFVDTVLRTVYDRAGTTSKRNIIFSSFNPDICLLLSFKQPSIPVLFLTDAGTSPVGDVRASSLQEAIRFASHWNLLGVVSAAEPLVISPRLVKVVKESGLVCVSYGTLNNDSDNVQLQVKEGIDAVIVDSVLKIRKGLTGSEMASASASNSDSANDNGNSVSTEGVNNNSEANPKMSTLQIDDAHTTYDASTVSHTPLMNGPTPPGVKLVSPNTNGKTVNQPSA